MCPIDAHCHHHCRRDPRITKDCKKLGTLWPSEFSLTFKRNVQQAGKLAKVRENSEAQNLQNLPILGSLLQWWWQWASIGHFVFLFFSPQNFTPRDAHCFWQWALLPRATFQLLFPLFFSPQNFTPRDAHCFWQWASKTPCTCMLDGSCAFLSSLKWFVQYQVDGLWGLLASPTPPLSPLSCLSELVGAKAWAQAAGGSRWPCGPLLPRQVRSGARYRGDATTDAAARKYHRPALVAGAGLMLVLRPGRSNEPRSLSLSLSRSIFNRLWMFEAKPRWGLGVNWYQKCSKSISCFGKPNFPNRAIMGFWEAERFQWSWAFQKASQRVSQPNSVANDGQSLHNSGSVRQLCLIFLQSTL